MVQTDEHRGDLRRNCRGSDAKCGVGFSRLRWVLAPVFPVEPWYGRAVNDRRFDGGIVYWSGGVLPISPAKGGGSGGAVGSEFFSGREGVRGIEWDVCHANRNGSAD